MADTHTLVAELESRLRPLEVRLGQAWWDANVNATDEAMARKGELELALRKALGDRDAFAAVVDALAGGPPPEEPARRQLERLRAAMLVNQVDEDLQARLVEAETRVEGTFSTHRGQVGGERVDDNRIAEILGGSDDVALRRAAWEASKSVGQAVAAGVRELVRLRNEAARALGFADHYALSLAVDELDEDRLFATLGEVDRATAGPFAAWKGGLDEQLAERFGTTPDALRPWHYDDPFFQQPPRTGRVDLDDDMAALDIEALTVRTYDGIGLDVRPVLERSDLYAREAKNQHAFCIDVDREGDVRVLANVVPNERWTETMLHEFGHAVYDRYVDPALPWFLRTPPHSLSTEAVAMLFGRLHRDPEWLGAVAGFDASRVEALAPRLHDAQRAGMLVFARWVLVMTHFERGLYRDPDADHDARWWDLVERFQLVRRPDGRAAPDWASKIHLAVAPVYYQNYLYGELMASQLAEALDEAAGGIVDRPEAGRWLAAKVFAPGAARRWDHHLEAATGSPLSVAPFVRQFASP